MEPTIVYRSFLRFNPECADARRDIGDSYEFHRTASRAFTGSGRSGNDEEKAEKLEAARLLWRFGMGLGGPQAIVQSLTEPQWEKAGIPTSYLRIRTVVRSLPLEFVRGELRSFSLLCRPSFIQDQKRRDQLDAQKREEWVRMKLGMAGLALMDLDIRQLNWSSSKGVGEAGGIAVLVEGAAMVTHPADVAYAVQRGIGPSKGLGFGLLLFD